MKEEVWECHWNKSPGPNGFNLNFIKYCCEVVKENIFGFLGEFHTNVVVPRCILASFIVLNPKKENHQDLKEYRTVCLIRCIYKILAKVLVSYIQCFFLCSSRFFAPLSTLSILSSMVYDPLRWHLTYTKKKQFINNNEQESVGRKNKHISFIHYKRK